MWSNQQGVTCAVDSEGVIFCTAVFWKDRMIGDCRQEHIVIVDA